MPLQAARLEFNADGVPMSSAYGDVYHSADGGLDQARHVFLAGNGLPGRWAGRERFVIVETGFGLGLNFLTTWQAWRDDPARCGRLHFVSVEKHPFSAADLDALYRRLLPEDLAPLGEQLTAHWPLLTPGAHRLAFDGGRVVLTLLFGDAETLLRQTVARADAFYLDGFAPAANPDMWSPGIAQALMKLAAPAATLATWSVAAGVRDTLQQAGFATEKHAGFGRKRHMLTGGLLPHAQRIAARHAPAPPSDRRAVVVGAGLAGCAVAERLAARGWQVALVERHGAPAQETSGNLAGLLRPMMAADDNLAARLSRQSFLAAHAHFAQLEKEGHALRWGPRGLLHLAEDASHADLQQEVVARNGFPEEFVRLVDAAQASALLGRPVDVGGWWFARGAWVNPGSVCEANLARAGHRLTRLFSREAVGLRQQPDGWQVCDGDGAPLAEAPVLVLANAMDARRFEAVAPMPLRIFRGQVTHLPAGTLALDFALCRKGYVAPIGDGRHCLGASFQADDLDPAERLGDHAANLARLERMLPGAASGLDPARLEGRVGFRTACPDRLPLLGALPDPLAPPPAGAQLRDVARLPGLHCALAYGPRGLTWATLAAELLASRIDAEPLPVEADLAAAVDPARFALRAARRTG